MGRGIGSSGQRAVRLGIDYNQWNELANRRMREVEDRERKAQQLYDRIVSLERNAESFMTPRPGMGVPPMAPDIIPNLRNAIKEYEKLSGQQYEGRGREIAGLAPMIRSRGSSGGYSTGSSGPSQKSLARQTEKAAIRSKQQQESQELADAQWLSKYDTRKADLERTIKQGNTAQERYNAEQELMKLNLENQRRLTRMPGYETPKKQAEREKIEITTKTQQASYDRQAKVTEANQQLDRLIGALDQDEDSAAIAEINKLRPQLDKGASAESIIRQARATAKAAEDKRIKKMNDEFEIWSRKNNLTKQRIDEAREDQQKHQVEMQNLRSELQKETQAARARGQSESLSAKLASNIQTKRTDNAAQLAYWNKLQSDLPPVPAKGADPYEKMRISTKAYIEQYSKAVADYDQILESHGASMGSGAARSGKMSRDDFYDDFIKEEGRPPTTEELEEFRRQGYWE